MYKIISLISFALRQFVLPNPFINLVDKAYAELCNCLFGGIFVFFAYVITGSWYVSSKEEAWKGSVGFLINYGFLTSITIVVSYFIHNIYCLACIILFIVIILYITERKLFGNKIPF